MTFITEKIRGAVTTAAATERPLMDLKWTWIGTAAVCAFFVGVREYVRIPTKPAMHSNRNPATCSDLKPARVPI